MSNNTEEEIPENVLFEITKAEIYGILRWAWLKPVLILLSVEGVAGLIGLIMGIIIIHTGIVVQVPLPIHVEIPSLDLDRVSIAMFQSAITVSGIIVGFFAVSFFFLLNWSDRLSENYAAEFRRERNQKVKNDLRKKRIEIEGATAGLCQYAHLVVENVIPIIAIMVVFFFYSLFSGIFTVVNIILDMNAAIAISDAILPLIRFILIYREIEAGKPFKKK
jgi:hypothetical protein